LFQLSFKPHWDNIVKFHPNKIHWDSCSKIYFDDYLSWTFWHWIMIYSPLNYVQRVKARYGEPKIVDVVFIISPFHSVKLESLFQNHKHPPLKLRICGFQERCPSKILHTIYILKCNSKFINLWIPRIKSNN
jgi:hypothetical protein